MPGLRDIKRRLQTARNIRKITYAMKLVATAKLKKAQESVVNTREYTTALRELIRELRGLRYAGDGDKFSNPLLEAKAEIRNISVVVIGGSRGLCGGYNTNINKTVEHVYAGLKEAHPGVSIDFVVLGKKPGDYLHRTGKKIRKDLGAVGEDPYEWPIEELCADLEREFLADELHEVHVIYTRFKSAISVTPVCDRLLPIVQKAPAPDEQIENVNAGDLIYEPSPQDVLNAIVPKVLRVRVLQASLDAKASEHGSRMTAMDSATKNGDDLIQRLQLLHNKLRQGSITSELLDIIGGANALE